LLSLVKSDSQLSLTSIEDDLPPTPKNIVSPTATQTPDTDKKEEKEGDTGAHQLGLSNPKFAFMYPDEDEKERREKINSPFDTVCIKHIRRHLNLFEDYYLGMIRDFYTQQTSVRTAYSGLVTKLSESKQDNNKKIADLKIQHENDLAKLEERFKISVHKLTQGFDQYLDGMVVCPLLLPVTVTLSIAGRPISFEMSCRAVDTLAHIRALLEIKMKELGDEIVRYGGDSRFFVQYLTTR
jgi:hypothetical protein